jgi:uncharacterized protein YbcI
MSAPPRVRQQDGDVRTAISDGMVALLKEFYGVGPTQAKTYYFDDLVVCLLRGGFTRVEQTLLEAGRGPAVIQQRMEFQQIMRPRFVEVVERATRRDVVAFMSGSQQDPDMLCETFVLRPTDLADDGEPERAAASARTARLIPKDRRPARAGRRPARSGVRWLDHVHVGRVRSLGTDLRLVRDLRALGERLEPTAADGGVVDEEVLALVVRRDEAEALFVAEPLDGSVFHVLVPPVTVLRDAEALKDTAAADAGTAVVERMLHPKGPL